MVKEQLEKLKEFYDSQLAIHGTLHTGSLANMLHGTGLTYIPEIKDTTWWANRRRKGNTSELFEFKQTGKRRRSIDSSNEPKKKSTATEDRIVLFDDNPNEFSNLNYSNSAYINSNNNNSNQFGGFQFNRNNGYNNNNNNNNNNNINQTFSEQLEDLNKQMKKKVSLEALKFDNKEVEELLNMDPPLFPQRIIKKIRDLLKEISDKMVISEITFSKGRSGYVRYSSGGGDVCIDVQKDNSDNEMIYGNDNQNINNDDEDIIEELITLLLNRKENIEKIRDSNLDELNNIDKNDRTENIKEIFQRQNRAGISSSFHRISAIFYDDQTVTGLTYRIGRMNVSNNTQKLFTNLMGDHQSKSKRKSILIIGPPGSGKTTLLRSLIRELEKKSLHVIVIDKTEEICGPTELVPKELGDRTRKIVPGYRNNQSIMDSLTEAVSNHSPDYVAVDELANKNEVNSIVAIGERGISVIATVHGKGIESVIRNKEVNKLLGGSQAVILSAGEVEERRNKGVRDSDRKSAISRVFPPLFDVVVELCDDDHCYIIDDPLSYYDRYLELL